MNDSKNGASKRRGGLLGRRGRNTFITKSGKTIKIHRNLTERIRANRDVAARRKAARLAGLPKSRVKRFFYHFHPKRVYHYWFSREGGVMALKITGIGIITGFLLLIGIFAYFRKDLINLKDLAGSNLGGSISYYDSTGQTLLWQDYDGVKRTVVGGDDISQYIKDATVAVEDKDFYRHGGFDVKGILRAGVNDIFGRGATQGGSTITQQLVKLNYQWTKDQTITRKIKELILAVELERTYSKSDILDGYLNTAPYGNVQYGVETAAQDYFHKSAKDVTIAEAAFLAAIPKSPSQYSPYGYYFKQDPDYWKEELNGRQDYILGLMLEKSMITKEQYDEAIAADTLATIYTPQPKYEGIKAPWFVLATKAQLEATYGEATVQRGGWKVTTTLKMDLQNLAEQQVADGLAQVKRQGGDMIAFAAEDVTTGQMVALVGGVDFSNPEYGQNNYAQLKIPPGSSIKPYDYVSFIANNKNVGAGSVLYDTKGAIPGYPCTTEPIRTGNCAIDYDLRFPGPITLRYALGGSRNIPAMKAMLSSDNDPQASVNKTISLINNLMGSPNDNGEIVPANYGCYADEQLTVPSSCFTSAAIGDGAYLQLDQHVHGYATLSRNGLNIPQTYILRINDASNNVVDEWKMTPGVQVVDQEAAYIVNDILSDPNASYLARKIHNYKGWNFGFKTGTTNDSKDGLMMGISTQYAAGVWVGYHNRTKALTGFMENMTTPILRGWMYGAHENLTPVARTRPSGIQTLPAYVVTAHVGSSSVEPSPKTDLFPSWYKAPSTLSGNQTIDIVSNKLATDCTPERARKSSSGSIANGFSVDKFVTGSLADSSQKDDIHKCDDTKPTIEVKAASASSVTVVVNRGTYPLTSEAIAGSINLVIGDQIVQSFPITDAQAGSPLTLTYNYDGSGQQVITVQIIDSVLYEGSDQTGTIDFGSGATAPLSANRNGNNVTFTWSGSSNGVVTVYYKHNGAAATEQTCTIVAGTCSASGLSGSSNNYTAYAKDGNGTQSNVVSF